MFIAAFSTRSCSTPPCEQRQVRTESGNAPSTCLQSEQLLLLGKNRSATLSSLPYQAHLQVIIWRKAYMPPSLMHLAMFRLLIILRTPRSSIATTSKRRTRSVVSLSDK